MFLLVTTLIGTRSYLHDCHLLLGSPRKKKKYEKQKLPETGDIQISQNKTT